MKPKMRLPVYCLCWLIAYFQTSNVARSETFDELKGLSVELSYNQFSLYRNRSGNDFSTNAPSRLNFYIGIKDICDMVPPLNIQNLQLPFRLIKR
jgi:hypothetical protein